MKLSQNISSLLNKQFKLELNASHVYLGIYAWFESTPFQGFANWMKKQVEEELTHAMKIFNYLTSRETLIEVPSLDKPKNSFKSPLEAFEWALKHEQEVTKSINEIYKAALNENDFGTTSFLHWFIDEQIEEEQNVTTMIEKLKLANDNYSALMNIDSHAKNR